MRTRFRAGSASVEIPRVGDSHGDLAVALAAGVLELDRYGSSFVGRRPMASKRAPMIANERELSKLMSSERRDPTRTPEWFEAGGGILGRQF